MMCTEPVVQKPAEPSTGPSSPAARTMHFKHSPSKSFDQPNAQEDDLESGIAVGDAIDSEEVYKVASLKGLTFAQVTNQIWHFCSVDHGPKCMFSSFFKKIFFILICKVQQWSTDGPQILVLGIIRFMSYQTSIPSMERTFQMGGGYGRGLFCLTMVCRSYRYNNSVLTFD